jgi:cell division protein FtsB
MIIENSPKWFLWLALLLVALSGLAVLGLSGIPLQLAKMAEIESGIRWQETVHEQVDLPRLIAEREAEIAKINAENEQVIAQIRMDQWLYDQIIRLRAAVAVGWAQFWLHTAYAVMLILTLVVGTASLGVILYALKRLFRHLPADLWQDPAYRRLQRDLARLREQLNQLQKPAAATESEAAKPIVPSGNSQHQRKPEREMTPPI